MQTCSLKHKMVLENVEPLIHN